MKPALLRGGRKNLGEWCGAFECKCVRKRGGDELSSKIRIFHILHSQRIMRTNFSSELRKGRKVKAEFLRIAYNRSSRLLWQTGGEKTANYYIAYNRLPVDQTID